MERVRNKHRVNPGPTYVRLHRAPPLLSPSSTRFSPLSLRRFLPDHIATIALNLTFLTFRFLGPPRVTREGISSEATIRRGELRVQSFAIQRTSELSFEWRFRSIYRGWNRALFETGRKVARLISQWARRNRGHVQNRKL